ncbi:MAG: carbon-nitrogen hydrolase family protein [Pseudomonadota bacterium]
MPKQRVRIASVQMALETPSSSASYFNRLEHFVRVASEYGADFVCFPEHITLPLLACEPEMVPADKAVDVLTGYTDAWKDWLAKSAVKFGLNIIGGSHAGRFDDGTAHNVSFFAHRGGGIEAVTKIHPTPDERDVWGIAGGDGIAPIETDCGPIGLLICYDSEFPELSRRLIDPSEISILFVPYLTDTRAGHLRVTYCCHARAIENQFYVVTSGFVGNITNVANLEMAYAQSVILTPNDHGFARDGIAAQAEPQVEQMIFADLDMATLIEARAKGSVRNLADRRRDLYRVDWLK